MNRLGRDAPLPNEMQGRWFDVDNQSYELLVNGGEVSCFGMPVEYDLKLIGTDDGALTVSLKIDDEANEDSFQRANITELVITPEGELHAYNTQYASQLYEPPYKRDTGTAAFLANRTFSKLDPY